MQLQQLRVGVLTRVVTLDARSVVNIWIREINARTVGDVNAPGLFHSDKQSRLGRKSNLIKTVIPTFTTRLWSVETNFASYFSI